MAIDTTKVLEAQDDLAVVRDLVQAIFMAAAGLSSPHRDAIQAVADHALRDLANADDNLRAARELGEG